MPGTDWLVRQIGTSVRGGLTPLQAYKDLCEAFEEAEVKTALTRFEEETKRIRTIREPATLMRQGLPSWYPGPSDKDRFWPPLRKHILARGWDEEAVNSIDQSSTKVLSLLPPPGQGQFSTKGLVLGYVQSGKTANFSAVIAKAADVGYKFFIVLSGITNNLRAQTQRRLQKELVNLNRQDWVELTSIEQDFQPGPVGNVDVFLTDHHSQKVLCVVKKNAAVLRRLLKWLKSAHQEVINNCPVLVIDDEADQASINSTGSDEKRTAINKVLLNILKDLPKVAFVGYTATPFANIFIDPSFDDLYPRDFIVDLPKPKGYFGPERIFGRERLNQDSPDESFDGLDMIRPVGIDEVPVLKPAGANDRLDFFPEITDSLQTALYYFWLATAARFFRGDENKHSTMLIHTTLYTDVHQKFQPLIDSEKKQFLQKVQSADSGFIQKLKDLWENEQKRVPSQLVDETPVTFEELMPFLEQVLKKTEIIIENSRSVLRLIYADDTGSVQIVIGGNTLSRGLTLEGLIVSYFVRTSTAYDTLLQMGRWFGYRPNYADLPRIWMTAELEGYFYDLATVEQEMRIDVKRYELENLTPLDFGVRIRTHPQLSITSKLKMQAAVPCDVSYSGRRLQTILFNHKDKQWLTDNLVAARALLSNLQSKGFVAEKQSNGNILLFDAPVSNILQFLKAYSFHPNSLELRSDLISDYIVEQNKAGRLKKWNIAIISRQASEKDELLELGQGIKVPLLTRSRFVAGIPAPHANLKAIMSEADRTADLPSDKKSTSNSDAASDQETRPEGTGFLLLYPIDKDSRPQGKRENPRRQPLEAVEHVLGVGLIFPEAGDKNTPQRYMTVDLSKIDREIEPELPDEEPEEEGVA